jgi:hypothetical protein
MVESQPARPPENSPVLGLWSAPAVLPVPPPGQGQHTVLVMICLTSRSLFRVKQNIKRMLPLFGFVRQF